MVSIVPPTTSYWRRNNIALCLSITTVILVSGLFLTTNENRGAATGFSKKRNGLDKFERTPLCDPSGRCGEDPSIPSPRTYYSANNLKDYQKWWKAHAKLNQSAAAFVETPHERPLVLIGDSITEAWLGTSLALPVDRAVGVPQVLQKMFATGPSAYSPLVLAIGGDQTQHLLWRLQNGELPESLASNPNVTYVMLIGTNNIGNGHLPGPSADGIFTLIDYLLARTNGRLLTLNVLPREDNFRLEKICPPRCKKAGGPYDSFMPAVDQINQKLQQEFESNSKYSSLDRVKLLDCGGLFVSKEGRLLADELMPDHLHPNADGHQKFAECILEKLQNW